VYQQEKIFDEILRNIPKPGFSSPNEITAQMIDETVHFLHKKSLRQLHDSLLHMVVDRVQRPGMPPLDQAFA